VVALTPFVVTGNVAVLLPAATVTLVGTAATLVLLLESATAAPPLGAAPLSVTVPFDVFPPTRLVGLTVSDASAGEDDACGFTVKVEDLVTPPPETEIVTAVCTLTEVVKMLKPPVVLPAGIVTLPGTEATAGLLLVTGRIRSADGGDATVTVPKELPPAPTVEVGFSVSDVGGCCGVSVT
jgi:hypothetical protein